jgi:hypothetical protein
VETAVNGPAVTPKQAAAVDRRRPRSLPSGQAEAFLACAPALAQSPLGDTHHAHPLSGALTSDCAVWAARIRQQEAHAARYAEGDGTG